MENKKLFGIFLSITSGLLFIGCNIIFEKTNLDFDDVLLIRSITQIISFSIALKIKGLDIWIWTVDEDKNIFKIRLLMLSQAIIGGIVNFTIQVSVYLLPLGDAMAIIFSNVFTTMLMAAIFLNEKIRVFKATCGIFVVAGIMMVIKPFDLFSYKQENIPNMQSHNESNNHSSEGLTQPSTNNHEFHSLHSLHSYYYMIGTVFALLSMVGASSLKIISTILYRNKSTSHAEMYTLYHGFGGLIVSIIVPLVYKGNQRIVLPQNDVQTYSLLGWISLFLLGFLFTIATFTSYSSIKFVGPIVVSFLRTSEIAISYFAQILFFGQIPDIISVLGGLLITIACICIPFEELAKSLFPVQIQKFL